MSSKKMLYLAIIMLFILVILSSCSGMTKEEEQIATKREKLEQPVPEGFSIKQDHYTGTLTLSANDNFGISYLESSLDGVNYKEIFQYTIKDFETENDFIDEIEGSETEKEAEIQAKIDAEIKEFYESDEETFSLWTGRVYTFYLRLIGDYYLPETGQRVMPSEPAVLEYKVLPVNKKGHTDYSDDNVMVYVIADLETDMSEELNTKLNSGEPKICCVGSEHNQYEVEIYFSSHFNTKEMEYLITEKSAKDLGDESVDPADVVWDKKWRNIEDNYIYASKSVAPFKYFDRNYDLWIRYKGDDTQLPSAAYSFTIAKGAENED